MRRKLNSTQRKLIYGKTEGHCAYCGDALEFSAMQVDHVVPIRKGGSDTLENMLPACRSCNHYKSSLDLEDFRDSIQRMPSVLLRDDVTYRIAVRFGIVVPKTEPVVFYYERNGQEE